MLHYKSESLNFEKSCLAEVVQSMESDSRTNGTAPVRCALWQNVAKHAQEHCLQLLTKWRLEASCLRFRPLQDSSKNHHYLEA